MRVSSALRLGLVGVLFLSTALFAQRADRKSSPFDGLRWQGDQPEVLVGSTWYRPLAIDGLAVDDILAACEKRWPGKMKKRFGEDLVEAMGLLGPAPAAAVSLEVEGLEDGKRVTLKNIAMTRAKREAIRLAGRARRPRPAAAAPAQLAREAAKKDLVALKRQLEQRFAYEALGDRPWREEISRRIAALPESVPTVDHAAWIATFMNGFRDGHARVEFKGLPRPKLYPPFLLREAEGGVVAFSPDRRAFLDPKRPFIVAIDGRPLEEWLERAGPFVVQGSDQLVRERSLRELRNLVFLRRPSDKAQAGRVRVKLTAAKGRRAKEMTLDLVPRRPIFGSWPGHRSGVLKGRVGYLRLPSMDSKAAEAVRAWMPKFRKTKGLIVDVRGNGGGTREALIALSQYLVGEGEGPWVGNVARYRSTFAEGHLDARFMWPEKHSRWSKAERQAIRAHRETFRAEWQPESGFSDWHYLVLGEKRDEGAFFYDKPVVVLSDAVCFSATDIFLGALKGRPRVTLMGQSSAGGSARSQRFELPMSSVVVRCASMVSFQPNGQLYDGRGVSVDIAVKPAPKDHLRGDRDRVLEKARARLK